MPYLQNRKNLIDGKWLSGKENGMKEFKNFLREEDGMGVVEVILIIVILISLALLFKTQITTLVNNILKKITTQAGKIYK